MWILSWWVTRSEDRWSSGGARWMSARPKAALFDQLDTNGDDEVNLQEFQAAQVRDLVVLLPLIQRLVNQYPSYGIPQSLFYDINNYI